MSHSVKALHEYPCAASSKWVIWHLNNKLKLIPFQFVSRHYRHTRNERLSGEKSRQQGSNSVTEEFKSRTVAVTGCKNKCLIEND